jgi:hypothetical protein
LDEEEFMKKKRKTGEVGPGFQHGQSAELVEEIKKRAAKERLSSQNTNEMGQQPLSDEGEKRTQPTPQELRERPRE